MTARGNSRERLAPTASDRPQSISGDKNSNGARGCDQLFASAMNYQQMGQDVQKSFLGILEVLYQQRVTSTKDCQFGQKTPPGQTGRAEELRTCWQRLPAP